MSSLRAHLHQLPPYKPVEPYDVLARRLGRDPETLVKLDANENPYGPLPQVREALAHLAYPHIYPDPESRRLRQALAETYDLPMEHFFVGAGADELIELIIRVLMDPGDVLVDCPPTFGMYSFVARVYNARVVEVPRNPDFSLRVDALMDAVRVYRPKVLFLATPNNPDGSLLSREVVDALLELPTVVVLDEAYIEFTDNGGPLGEGNSRIREVPHRKNLVVLRTFSKAAGLAGLRVGYGAFPLWLTEALWKVKQPYNVSVAAQVAAEVTLRHREDLIPIVERLRAERQRLYEALQTVPYLEPYPSQTNFILVRVREGSAQALRDYLAQEHGILVRYFSTPGLSDCVRISVGRPEDTDRLLEALAQWTPQPLAAPR